MSNKFGLDKVKRDFKAKQQQLARKVADEARSFFVGSFTNQGFTDSGLQKWHEVQRRISGTNSYKYPKSRGLSRRTKAINVNTGRLRNSVRARTVTFSRTVINSDVKYANYVNASRRFIGRSKTLENRLRKIIDKGVYACFPK